MKPQARQQAVQLRMAGKSIREIALELGVSRSSVSLWVRHIELTEAQRDEIKHRHPYYHGQHAGSKANRAKFLAIRQQYQAEGRLKAQERDPLHIAGCMLFWAEGKKDKNCLSITNSDPGMLQFFAKFLRECLHVADEQMVVYINCYTGNGLSLEEIEQYWLDVLKLPHTCLRKSVVNSQPRSSQQKGRKLYYGVCCLAVHKTQLVQQVYGAIQEYAGIDKPEWLY